MLFAAIAASPVAAQRFEAETITLPNGLQVVTVPNHRVAAITQMVWYKTGAADDPRGKSGIAHFLEHLMFKGTHATPPGAFSAQIAQNGGRDNAFTTEDYTVFHETVAKDRLDLVMGLEADRMTGLVLDDSVVLPERDVILEERRMRIDNDPSALLTEQLMAGLFLNASYHNPTIGWEHEMRGLGSADALAFYRDWYAPNNAVLIVAGDVEPAEARTLAEHHFGPLVARPVPQRLRLDEPPHHAAVRLEMKSPRVAQPSWRRIYLAPSYGDGASQHAYALQVLAEILAGSAGSRLNQALVLDKGLALTVGAGYSPSALGLTDFGVYATPKPRVAIADLEAAVDAELHRLIEHGVEPEEVAQAVKRMQASAIYSQDSLTGPANIIGTALAIGRSLRDVAAWPDRIGAVTPADVLAAARAVLVERNSATGILLPERTS
ncbi:MAG: insulinase family protein [Alphaproteobacteria bacterium]|nr:insulinase family protein [Alphaproteobacteria bacterium]